MFNHNSIKGCLRNAGVAVEIQADLAAESKREAKGVSWDLHQRECDKNEALEYEIETLKTKVAELEKPIAKIATLANQLKLSKASTYHNRMGTLIEELTGVALEKRNITKPHKST